MLTTYFDKETKPIAPRQAAPMPACVQFAQDGPVTIRSLYDSNLYVQAIQNILRAPRIVGHNAAYDMAVLANHGFMEEVFQAYDEGRVECTMVNQRLIDIAVGNGLYHKYGLDTCLARNGVPITVDKSDPWRMRYWELAFVDPAQWPREAYQYAHDDVIAVRGLDRAHDEAREAGVLDRAGWFARNAFWLHLMTVAGLRTDQTQVKRYHKVVQARIDKEKALLVEYGLVWGEKPEKVKGVKAPKWGTPGGRNTKAAAERMLDVMGGDAKPTAKGGVSLDEEACEESGDPVLQAYQRYGSAKNRLARVETLFHEWIQPSFVYPLETGRASSRKNVDGNPLFGDQIHNPPREPGYRECYIPPDGEYLCASDFKQMELCGWSQSCHDNLGWSDMAEAINAGQDLHVKMGVELASELYGRQVSYEELLAAVEAGEKWAKDIRQLSKIANFGLPGGMGAETFLVAVRKVDGFKDFELEQAEAIVTAWKRTWKQARAYLNWISDRLDGEKRGTTRVIRDGHYRGDVGYCQMANHEFQALCAYAACDAGWELTRECYLGVTREGTPSPLANSRPRAFIHDEFLLTHPIAVAHEAALRQAKVQAAAAQKWMPNVRIESDPALMERWTKSAKTVYGEDGRLQPWRPKGGWDAWFEKLEKDELS